MKDRLRASDYRFLAVCLALLAATVWFSAHYFYRAFPEASIDFRVNRDDARVLAVRFLAGRNDRVEGYREASRFGFDDTAKTFLERQAGLQRANRLMSTRLKLWRWSYRWFRPQQKEEFRAEITPSGEVAGFTHEIAEDAARPAATTEEARAAAENFLRTVMHRDPASLEFVEVVETVRPNRVDRVFTWKERDFNLQDATSRVEVTMLGNEVGGYGEYLKVPEAWQRDYQRLRSKNEMAQTVDTALLVILMAGLIVVIVLRVRRGDLRWRRAALIGLAGVALAFCAAANEFPLREFDYHTTDSYSSFLAQQLFIALAGALAAGGLLFVLTAGAEPLYREAYPRQISLGNLFRPAGLRTRRFLLGAVLGMALTGIFVAYQTGFYMFADRLGAWAPADVPYSNLLNTRFPWLFVLFGGFFPAISEEFLFRMFAIPFLRKVVRWLPAAVVLAGFIWGFGHAGYPNQPFYIRGVEVGIGGVALGLVMLRWGILPTLVWHYSVDAMYSALLLVRSPNWYLKLSGAAGAGIIVLPVVAALIAYWRNGGFEPETGLLNGDEAPPAEIAPVEAPAPRTAAGSSTVRERPLAWRIRIAAVATLALGLLSLLIPAARFGERPKYKIPAEQARAAADAFLRSRGLDPAAFRHVTFPATHWGGDDGLAGKYFLERRPVADASQLFERNRPVQHWMTRYFKSLDKEELNVSVHPETGKVLGFRHDIPEDRPGADLAPDAARALAASFAAAQGFDTGAMDLKESSSEKKKARRDYTLVWEARPGDPRNVGEARYRVEIEVSGDQVTSERVYWWLPEAYERARSRENAVSIAAMVLRFGLLSASVVCGVMLIVGHIRKHRVPWRVVMLIGGISALLTGAAMLLSIRLTDRAYMTAVPYETWLTTQYLMVLMAVVFGFVMAAGAAALVSGSFPECLEALRFENRRLLARDAIFALAAAAGFSLAIRQTGAWLMDRFHGAALFSIGAPQIIASAAPAASAIAGTTGLLFDAALLALVVVVGRRLPRRWMIYAFGLLLVFGDLPGGIRTPGELALHYGLGLLYVACAAAFCRWFARGNYLAYAAVLWALALREPLSELFGTGNPALTAQGWVVLAVLAAGWAWALLPALARKPEAVEAQA